MSTVEEEEEMTEERILEEVVQAMEGVPTTEVEGLEKVIDMAEVEIAMTIEGKVARAVASEMEVAIKEVITEEDECRINFF